MKNEITIKLNPEEVDIILRGLGYSYNADFGDDDELNKEIKRLENKIINKIKKLNL